MSAGVCRKKKTYKIFSIFKLQTTWFWMFYVQRAQLGQPASHKKNNPLPSPSIQCFHIPSGIIAPLPGIIFITPILFKHIGCVIADL